MQNTITYSNVSLGDPSDDRIIAKHVPFTVDGIAATQISEGVWAYRLLPMQRRAVITELPPPSD